MKNLRYNQSMLRQHWRIPALFAGLKILMHLPFLSRYGYHHDELYFLDCGRHLSFGYVDHAPMIPWIARLADTLFGQSLVGLRIFSVLAGAAAIFITGLLVYRLGGNRFAVIIASLSFLAAGVFIREATILCIPAFEPLFWVSCAYLIVRIVQENNPKLWIWIGVLLGLGLMTKHSTAFLCIGIAVGVMLTPLRAHLKTGWPYVAAGIAFLIFLPNLLWQISNGWPTLEFLRNLDRNTLSKIPWWLFIAGQFFYLSPFSAPVWIAGLVFFFTDAGKPYRAVGWIYATVFLLLIVIKSKIYYLSPAYPMLFAAGSVAIERFIARRSWSWAKPAGVGILLISGATMIPAMMPILSIDGIEHYINGATFGLFKNVYELTGDLHGEFGWKERVETVAKVYNSLPPQERDSAIIGATWYGIAGAINYFGEEYGLPKAVSGHMTYYLWGLPQRPISTVIVANAANEKWMNKVFDDVTIGAQITLENVNPWERQFTVAICRRPKVDIHELWPKFKNYN
jgi:hypothetical protein